jgi:histidinol phosphatase-like PHP family hydrolase
MIDLHTHTLFSDGVLLPSELVYRAKFKGYTAIALTDHGDFSTFDFAIPRLISVASQLTEYYDIQVIPGVEITYVPPPLLKEAVTVCRKLGAKLIVVHGETPAETVPPGTNRAAILSGADILAHPGYITGEEVLLAKENDIYLEITTRNGHNKANSLVAELALCHGTKIIMNTDSHEPDNLLTAQKITDTLKMSNLPSNYYEAMQNNAKELINKL